MLSRQKILLAILQESGGFLNQTRFVKLAFLLREEGDFKERNTFYDFVPYKYGPFSFALYRELEALKRDGYIEGCSKGIRLKDRTTSLTARVVEKLPRLTQLAVSETVRNCRRLSHADLLTDVYHRFPWFAIKSELDQHKPKITPRVPRAKPAIYTVGYEGKSVDFFFNDLLHNGIRIILDVRANPVSRKYGFARRSLGEVAEKMGIGYRHIPELGIRSTERANLSDFKSYQRLLRKYETEMLPLRDEYVDDVSDVMAKTPAALLCMERDVRCCHRSRLATVAADRANLPVAHL